MTYNINDKFYNEYEPEVAIFCNANGYKLVELEKEIVNEVECRVFQIQEIVKTLEELKAEKIENLKTNRDAFKKTIVIKDNITLQDLNVGTYDYENLKNLKYGWVQEDLELFNTKMDLVVNQYLSFKSQINACESIEELDLIEIIFNRK